MTTTTNPFLERTRADELDALDWLIAPPSGFDPFGEVRCETQQLEDRVARRKAATAHLAQNEAYLKMIDGLQPYYDENVVVSEIETADYDGDRDELKVGSIEDANIIGSGVEASWDKNKGHFTKHRLLLDLDHAAMLVPSSTEGHAHLYVDVEIEHAEWEALIKALAAAGVIERGYADVSLDRGHTDLRLPWIKKGGLA